MYYQLLPTPTFLTVFKYQKLPHQYKNRIAFTFSPHRNVLHLEKYKYNIYIYIAWHFLKFAQKF